MEALLVIGVVIGVLAVVILAYREETEKPTYPSKNRKVSVPERTDALPLRNVTRQVRAAVAEKNRAVEILSPKCLTSEVERLSPIRGEYYFGSDNATYQQPVSVLYEYGTAAERYLHAGRIRDRFPAGDQRPNIGFRSGRFPDRGNPILC